MDIKASVLLVFLAALVLNFSGCDQDDTGDINEPITVGLVLPLSGSLSALGTTLQNGADLALEEVNSTRDQKIQFIIEDSGGSTEGAITAYNKLIDQDGITSIIGPVTSSETEASFPIAQEKKVVGLSPLAAASGLSKIGDFVFQANLTVDVVIPGGVEITASKFGYQKVAILVDTQDLFSQSANHVLKDTFKDQGIEILTTETLETDDTDFSAQLSRIINLEPDAIFISTLPNEAVGILIEANTQELSDEITIIIPFAFSSGEIEKAGVAAEDVVTFSTWVSSATTPGNPAFVESYRASYGTEPSRFVAQEYASVHIFAEAIRNAPSTDSDALRTALANIKNLDTILGKFSFDANGQAIYDPIILVVKEGGFEVLQ